MSNGFIESPKKYAEGIDKAKHLCKCGHKVVVPTFVEKKICNWCGNFVYRDKRAEFKDRLMKELRLSKC